MKLSCKQLIILNIRLLKYIILTQRNQFLPNIYLFKIFFGRDASKRKAAIVNQRTSLLRTSKQVYEIHAVHNFTQIKMQCVLSELLMVSTYLFKCHLSI